MTGAHGFATGLSSATPIEPVPVSPVPASIPLRGKLFQLADQCEQAIAADRELDEAIWLAATPGARAFDTIIPDNEKRKGWTIREQRDPTGRLVVVPAYTASLDAALTLVPEGDGSWPQTEYLSPNPNNRTVGHRWRIWFPIERRSGHSKVSAALALCAAALRAKAQVSA